MRTISVVLALLVLMIAGGCGGGEDEVVAEQPTATVAPEPTEPPTPTPEPTATPVRELSWEDIVEKLEPSTVMIRADFPETAVSYEGQGSGTGIVYSDEGYILTNAHVVSGAAALTVATAGSSKERSARFVGVSSCDELAVIQVTDMSGLEVAELGATANERVGAEVAALGYPLGDMLSLDLTVSRGVISKMNESLWEFESLIQHDALINPGNSGGPLVNRRGEVIGINTVAVDPSMASNINFAIDINQAKPIIADLEKGTNRHWLGMNLEQNFYPEYFGTEEGLIVAAVASGSSASNIGVQAPYLLTHLEGLSVSSHEDICRILRSHNDGDALKVEFTHITNTEVQFLEGEVVLGKADGGLDVEVVRSIAFDGGQTPTANGDAEELTIGQWEGVATVEVEYWAPCGEGDEWISYDTQTWSHDVRVLVDTPFDDELNPLWLEVFTEAEDEGGFWLLSSWDYDDVGLHEYWDLDYFGTEIFGELFALKQGETEVGNEFYTNLWIDPCSDAQGSELVALELAIGTVISGSLDSTGGTLTIIGMTDDLYRDLDITIEVTRIQ
jgi:S1-C subfamily serine protease